MALPDTGNPANTLNPFVIRQAALGLKEANDNLAKMSEHYETIRNYTSRYQDAIKQGNVSESLKSKILQGTKLSLQQNLNYLIQAGKIDEVERQTMVSQLEVLGKKETSLEANLAIIDQIKNKTKEIKINDEEDLDQYKLKNKALTGQIEKYGKFGQQVDSLVRSISGFSTKELFSISMIVTQMVKFLNMEKDVSLLQRQFENLNNTSTKTVDQINLFANAARIGSQQAFEDIQKASEMRIDIQSDLNNINGSFLDEMEVMHRGLGTNNETFFELTRNAKSYFGGIDEEAKNLSKRIFDIGYDAGLSGKELDSVARTVQASFKNLYYTMPMITKNGEKMFDPKLVDRYSKGVADMTLKFSAFGIGAEKVGEILNKALDLHNIEQNMFAFSQMGISMDDVLNKSEQMPEKLMNGLQKVGSSLSRMGKWQRQMVIDSMKGLVDEQTAAAMMKSPEKMKEIIEGFQRKEAGKTAMEDLRAKTLESIGQAWSDLKPLFDSLLSLIGPLAKVFNMAFLPLITDLGKGLQKITGFFGDQTEEQKKSKHQNIQTTLLQILVGSFAGFGAIKGLLGKGGGIGFPVKVVNLPSGGFGGSGGFLSSLTGGGGGGGGILMNLLKNPYVWAGIGTVAMTAGGFFGQAKLNQKLLGEQNVGPRKTQSLLWGEYSKEAMDIDKNARLKSTLLNYMKWGVPSLLAGPYAALVVPAISLIRYANQNKAEIDKLKKTIIDDIKHPNKIFEHLNKSMDKNNDISKDQLTLQREQVEHAKTNNVLAMEQIRSGKIKSFEEVVQQGVLGGTMNVSVKMSHNP